MADWTVVHFDFVDRDGRRLVTLRELGLTKSVRAKVGPPVLVAKVFDLYDAFSPQVYGRLQRAALGHEPETVEAPVLRPDRFPKASQAGEQDPGS
ncbi:MAG: hypothetical protein ACYCO4_03865 [Sulfobacillus sp.]